MILLACAALFAAAHSTDFRNAQATQIAERDYYRIDGRASSYTPGAQAEPAITGLNDGFALVWESRRQAEGRPAAILRTFSRHGAPLASEDPISSHPGFGSQRPAVTLLKGAVVVGYESMLRDGSGNGVFIENGLVGGPTRGEQSDLVLAAEGQRGLAAWTTQVSRFERRIALRPLDARGAPHGEVRVLPADQGESCVVPSIASLRDGFLLAYQKSAANGCPAGIWVRRLTVAGTPVGEPVKLSATGVEPTVSRLSKGAAVAWSEPSSSGNFRGAFALLDEKGRAVGRTVRTPRQNGSQTAAGVAEFGRDAIVVAWNLRADDRRSIYFSVYDRGGRQRTEPILATSSNDAVMAEGTGRQRIADLGNGAFAIAWSGNADLGDDNSANFTIWTPASEMTTREMATLRSYEHADPGRPHTISATEDVRFVTEAAVPHDPPTFDPKLREDPWGPILPTGDETGFIGIPSTGWTPPDPHLACGPNQLVAMTNGAIAFFDKDGTKTFQDEIENTFGFWGALGPGNFVFDPEVIYDPHSGRFFAMACERTNGSFFLLAVSDDSNPNGNWHKYRLNVSGLAGNDIDSPNISADANNIYLTADFFTGGQKYLVYILRKSELLVGAAPVTRSFLQTGTQSYGLPVMYDAAAPAQYMIEHFEASNNTSVRLWAILDPMGAPALTSFSLTVPAYGPPEDPPSQGTTARPETFDSRFWSCVYRNGSLWATHHVNSSRVRARWYEIAMRGWPNSGQTPLLVQSGEVDPGGTVRTFFSSISVDAVGNAAVVCARSSPSEFISMFRAVRRVSDALGTMPHTAIIKQNTDAYSGTRWGDYSGCVVDPADDRTFWGHHEWSQAGAWRTWIAPFVGPPTLDEEPITQIIPMLAGSIVGGLPEIAASDDGFLVVNPAPVVPDPNFASRVDYVTTVPFLNLLTLGFRVEGRVDSGVGEYRVLLLNRTTGLYDLMATSSAGFGSDVILTSGGVANHSQYIEAGTKQVRLRIELRRILSTSAGQRPAAKVDEVKILTSY